MKAELAVHAGTWIQNFNNNLGKHSVLFFWIPALLTLLGWIIGFINKKPLVAFSGSAVGMLGLISVFGAFTFPFLLPSSTHLSHSLTIYDASSSQFSLFIMLLAVIIFMPIVLCYTAWVYKVLAGPIDEKFISEKGDNVY
jgi:cytochrome d ubiquinol oxidase subunit II